MARQGYHLQFARYDEGIAVYTPRMEHSPTSATGTGWEPTPWKAVPRAAWETRVRVLAGCHRKGATYAEQAGAQQRTPLKSSHYLVLQSVGTSRARRTNS